jgi:hypothetical protein
MPNKQPQGKVWHAKQTASRKKQQAPGAVASSAPRLHDAKTFFFPLPLNKKN